MLDKYLITKIFKTEKCRKKLPKTYPYSMSYYARHTCDTM